MDNSNSKPSYEELLEQNTQLKKQIKEICQNPNRILDELKKKEEKQLKQSVENLENTINLFPGIIVKANLKTGFCVEANRAVKRILGYSMEEFTSKPLVNFIHPDDIQKTTENISEQLEGKEVAIFESRFLCKDGTCKWISWNITNIDTDGMVLGFGSDITKGKEAEQELIKAKELAEENEQKLKQSDRVFNLTLDMFCIAGFDGFFKYLNPAWERTLGWSIAELLSKPWLDFVYPEDVENTENIKSVIVDGKEIYQFENRYICKDGSIKWLSWNSQPFPKENIMIGAVRDITETKEIERELLLAKKNAEENSGKLKAAMESMSDAVFISDADGKFINFNDAFATFHKFKNKDECAKTLKEYPAFLDVYYLNKEFVPSNMWVVSRALRGESGLNNEYILKRKDTEETWIGSYNYAPIRNKKGDIIGSVVTARDITERNKVEEELNKHRKHLEELVKERTKELEEKNSELENYNQLFIGREYRIKELKDKVKDLEEKLKSK